MQNAADEEYSGIFKTYRESTIIMSMSMPPSSTSSATNITTDTPILSSSTLPTHHRQTRSRQKEKQARTASLRTHQQGKQRHYHKHTIPNNRNKNNKRNNGGDNSDLVNTIRPSMAGWWICCSCESINNPALCPERCTLCPHYRCGDCVNVDG